MGDITFSAWDVGGHVGVRNMWKQFFVKADAIIFVIDAADPTRMTEASDELHKLLVCMVWYDV